MSSSGWNVSTTPCPATPLSRRTSGNSSCSSARATGGPTTPAPGWARTHRPPSDVTAVRRRQRDLGEPEAFEWVHETTPDLLAVARSAGLEVLLAPLMVLERAALVPGPAAAGRHRPHPGPGVADVRRRPERQPGGRPPGLRQRRPRRRDGAPSGCAGPAERDAAPPLGRGDGRGTDQAVRERAVHRRRRRVAGRGHPGQRHGAAGRRRRGDRRGGHPAVGARGAGTPPSSPPRWPGTPCRTARTWSSCPPATTTWPGSTPRSASAASAPPASPSRPPPPSEPVRGAALASTGRAVSRGRASVGGSTRGQPPWRGRGCAGAAG